MRNRLTAKSHVKNQLEKQLEPRPSVFGWLFRWHFLVPFKTKQNQESHQHNNKYTAIPIHSLPPICQYFHFLHPTQPNQQNPSNHTNNPSNNQPCNAQQPNAFVRWVSSSIFPLASRNASWSEAWARDERIDELSTFRGWNKHTPWKKNTGVATKIRWDCQKKLENHDIFYYQWRYNERGRLFWNSNFDWYRLIQ